MHVSLIDRPRAGCPTPLIVLATRQREHFVRRYAELMNLVRLEIEDRQFLPLQRIGENLIEQRAFHRDHERFVADARVEIVALHFAERHRRERLLAGFCFRRVL